MSKLERHTNEAGDFALVDETGYIEVYRFRGTGLYELETSLAATPEETADFLADFGF